MKLSRSATYSIGTLAVAAFLAACSGNGFQSTGATPSSGGTAPMGSHHVPFARDQKYPGFTGVKTPTVKPNHVKSWVSPDLKGAPRIMFVTDYGSNVVDIYTMPNLALKGQLTGFSGPQGECSDKSGNIWITNTNTSQIFKYSRTGSLLATLSDTGYFPVGCAVNKSNGDLAVSNLITTAGGNGNVEVYAGGSGTPTPLTNSNQLEYFFPAYDTSGNLYVDGFSSTGSWILSVCPAGSGSCSSMSVSGATPAFPGGLNWDRVNNQLVVGDQECGGLLESCQYQTNVSGTIASIVGTTVLSNFDGTACDVDQGALAPFSKYFAGGCITFGTSVSSAARWAYTAGGTPNHYNNSGLVEPIGAAISNK